MGTITRDFSYREFEASATAERKGICNVITSFAVRDAVKELVDKVLQPLRDRVGRPLRVNSGYRCPELNKEVGGAATSQHCFDTETEILTNNGWKRSETISAQDLVFSYNFSSAIIELKPINEIIRRHFVGELYHVRNKHIDVMCTDRHNMIVRYDNNKYQRKGTNKITPEGQAYFDSLKTDNDQFHLEKMEDVFGKRRHFMTCGYSAEKTDYDSDFMRFVMAVVADGYFGLHAGKTPYIGFHVKKEQKVTYLKEMMSSLGIKFSHRKAKDDTYFFYVGKDVANKTLGIIGPQKLLPVYILKADVRTLRELIGTYVFFDGCRDKREGTIGIGIATVNAHNASILQAMCVLSGMRCVAKVNDPRVGRCIKGKMIKTAQQVHVLSLCPDKISSKTKEDNYEKVAYDGEVWCVRDDNDTVIIRRNGRVSIQGNCRGEAADIAAADPHLLARAVRDTPEIWAQVDQMILYNDFVHLSHKRGGPQRRQLLYNRRYTGERL